MLSFPKQSIVTACQCFGPLLKLGGMTDWRGNVLDPVLVMWAFAGNESMFGADCEPRFEPAYFPPGRYSTESWQAGINAQYGKDAAKSYGPWQVMFCNCKGYKPEEFLDPQRGVEAGAQVFIAFTNRLVESQMPKTLDQLGDAYNTGNYKDKNVPFVYISRLRKHYDTPMVEAATV